MMGIRNALQLISSAAAASISLSLSVYPSLPRILGLVHGMNLFPSSIHFFWFQLFKCECTLWNGICPVSALFPPFAGCHKQENKQAASQSRLGFDWMVALSV